MRSVVFAAAASFGLLAGCQSNDLATEGGNRQLLYVHDALVECVGVVPMQCMQVRNDPAGDWSYFYSNIEGFTYEHGYRYTLSIDVFDIANPPADASSKRYVLVDVLEKSKRNE